MKTRVDSDSHAKMILKSILDYEKDTTTYGEDTKNVYYANQHRMRNTEKGCRFKALWIDGNAAMIPLKCFKESNLIDVTEFLKQEVQMKNLPCDIGCLT